MKTPPPLHLAGYQGGTSILTGALTHLARQSCLRVGL